MSIKVFSILYYRIFFRIFSVFGNRAICIYDICAYACINATV